MILHGKAEKYALLLQFIENSNVIFDPCFLIVTKSRLLLVLWMQFEDEAVGDLGKAVGKSTDRGGR